MVKNCEESVRIKANIYCKTTHLARRHHHVVAEPTSNDRVVHDRLVGLVLEVRVPTRAELGARPAVHLLELLLSRADLNTSINAVGGKRTSAVDLPLLKDLLLDLGITTDEIIERLDVGFRTVCGESQVVVLEVQTDTGKVDERLDTSLAQLLGVADTRALQDEWGGQGAARDDDLLAGLVDLGLLVGRERLGRDDLDACGTAVLNDDLLALAVDNEVQVLVLRAGAVNVSVGRVGTTAGVSVDPLKPVLSTVASDQILEIIGNWNVLGLDGTKEVLHDRVGVVAEGDLDGTVETVDVAVVAGTLVCLVLPHERDEFLSGPALGLEIVVVGSRRTSVHHEVDAGAATEDVSDWDDRTTTAKPFGGPRVVEGRSLAVELHVLGVDTGTVDPRVLRDC
jgi:hypothetical protein